MLRDLERWKRRLLAKYLRVKSGLLNRVGYHPDLGDVVGDLFYKCSQNTTEEADSHLLKILKL